MLSTQSLGVSALHFSLSSYSLGPYYRFFWLPSVQSDKCVFKRSASGKFGAIYTELLRMSVPFNQYGMRHLGPDVIVERISMRFRKDRYVT